MSVAATFLNEVLLPVAVAAHFTEVIHCSSRTVCRDGEGDPELISAAVMSTNLEVNDQISELAVLTGLECRGVTGTKRLPANSPQWTSAGARVRRGHGSWTDWLSKEGIAQQHSSVQRASALSQMEQRIF